MLKKFLIGAFVALALMVTSTASAAYDFGPTTLKVGSKGEYVKTLQTLVGAIPDGSFGPMTKAKVATWQASCGGLTVDGVFGPMSMAKANAGCGGTSTVYPAGCTSSVGFSTTTGMSCSSTTTYPAGCTSAVGFSPTTGQSCSGAVVTTGGPLAGTSGDISDMNTLSSYNNEEVGAGQKDVKVLGVDVEASNDGDIALNIMKVRFDSTGNASGDSDRIEDYLTSVSVWQGSTKVGTAMATDFSKDSTGIYTKSITLSNAVVRADKIEKFYVSVDAVNNLDSGDIDSDSWTIALDSVRFTDGSGVVTTETGAIPTDMDWDSAGDGIAMSFVSLSSASDTELKIQTNTVVNSQVVKVNTSNNTDGVVLLQGKLKLDGTSTVWLDEMPVTFTTTGDSIDALTGSVILTIGGNTYTESTGTNCTPTCAANTTAVVTFDNLNLTLAAGSTTNFTVSADLNDIENTGVTATDFDEGDTLLASILTTNRDDIIAENSAGDQLTDATEMTGSLTGNAQAFYSSGINVALVGSPTAVISHVGDIVGSGAGDDDQATFSITFDVTAFGSDAWIDKTAPTASGGATESDLDLTATGTAALTSASIAFTAGYAGNSSAITGTNAYKVEQDTTKRFTITAVSTVSVDGFVKVALTDLLYALTDVDGDTQYTFNLTDFKTQDLFMNAN